MQAWAQWQTITPFGGNINDVYFLNARDGIAVGQQGGIGNCSAPCFISRTVDGGQNWIRLFPTGITTTTLNAVDFSGNTGLACGTSSAILKTTDAGYTWTQPTAGVGSGYNDLAFTGTNTAVVIGNNGLIRFSSNAGNSWTTVASGVSVTLNSISSPGNGVVFIGGSNGTLLKSTNAGNNWSVVNTGLTTPLFRISFVDAQQGYFASGTTMYKTTNGGTTWSAQSLTTTGFVRKIRFLDAQHGCFVTDAGEWGSTSDAGATWIVHATGYHQALYSFRFMDPMTVVSCGDQGTLIRSNDGGESWFSQLSGITDEQFGLLIQDTAVVWSCGRDGSVFRSRNAGFTWQRMKTHTNGVFLNVNKINSQKVILCADSGRVFIGDNHAFELEEVWVDSVQGIKDAWFRDSLVGWACSTGPNVYKTTDGGHTWTFLSMVASGDFLQSIQFINDSIGFLAGNAGVYKTINGGLNWIYTPFSSASSLKDIRFYNDSVGYCAGGFGKMMKTVDQGNSWFVSNPTLSGSLNVSSIRLLNDSTVYVASGTSQKLSIDGGENFGSMSTACLANNWSTNAIDVTAPDTLGFCTGGISGLMHKLSYRDLNAVVTDRNAYCSNESIEVFFRGSGLAFSNWSFTIQLSDAAGSFANPIAIGSNNFNQLNYMVSGLVRCPIPAGTPSGVGYRVRVVCGNPILVSPDNGYDIAISPVHTPTVTVQGNAEVCLGDPVALHAQEFAGGSNPQWNWFLNGSLVQQGSADFLLSSPQAGDAVYVSMTSSLPCASPSVVLSDTVSTVVRVAPALTLSNDTVVCTGSSVQLQVQSSQPVQWFPTGLLNNDTVVNPTWVANQPQVFWVRSGLPGCASVDTVWVSVWALPEVEIGAVPAVCPGSCIALTPSVSDASANLSWSPSGLFNHPTWQNPTACLSSDAWIYLAATDSNGCAALDSAWVMVHPAPPQPILLQQGDTLSSNGFVGYQWVLNGLPIAGATNSSFVVQQAGTYWVVGTDANGCTVQSDSVNVVLTGRQPVAFPIYTLSPSPVVGWLQVQSVSTSNEVELAVFTGAGVLVQQHGLVQLPFRLDAGALAEGLYVLELRSKNNVERRRFIKVRQ